MKCSLYTLVLIASITACGQAPQDPNAAKANDPTTDPGTIDYGPDTKEVITEYKRVGSQTALALDSTKDLPECDLANDGQLAFIKPDNQFYTCDAVTKIWETIDLKGAQGQQGIQGAAGKDGEVAVLNNWSDPITSLKWLIGGSANRTEAQSFCTAPYRLPTESEAYIASQHGLGLASHSISGPTTLWSVDFAQYGVDGITPFYRFIDLTSPNQLAIDSASTVHGVVCVHQ